MEYATLSNGVKMPMLGFGVYQIPPEDCERCVLDAIKVGNRLIDTAQYYNNEAAVGNAIQKSGIPREEFFIVTKVWFTNDSYEKTKASIDESLSKLKTSYVDLLLIHKPVGNYYRSYRALEDAYREGKARAIGVSSFNPRLFKKLYDFAEIKPMVNQVETHVFYRQKELHEMMDKLGVKHMSWAPFAEGENGFFSNPLLTSIGKKYGKSVAQVALRFMLQSDIILIPKSKHIERMEQNFDVFDFELSDEDMKNIATLDRGKSIFGPEYGPHTGKVLYFLSKLINKS